MVTKTRKTEKLIIRCEPETKKRFYLFVVENGFKSGEDALKFLLKKARELDLKPERGTFF